MLDMINKGNNPQGHHRDKEFVDGIRRSLGVGGQGGHHLLPPQQQLQHHQALRHLQGGEGVKHEQQQEAVLGEGAGQIKTGDQPG